MPGSPVEVKIQTRSSPPNMPPLPPVNPGGPRPVSFTPAARKPPVNHFAKGLAQRGGALLVPASGRAPCLPGCWPAQSRTAGSEGWGFPSAYVGHTMGSVVQPCPLLLVPMLSQSLQVSLRAGADVISAITSLRNGRFLSGWLQRSQELSFVLYLAELIPILLYLALQTAFLQLRLESFPLLISQPRKFLTVCPSSLFSIFAP